MSKPKPDPQLELNKLRTALHAYFNTYPAKEEIACLNQLRALLYGPPQVGKSQ